MRRFALIGFPLGHSFSALYFQRKFKEEEIRDAEYSLIEMPEPNVLPELVSKLPNLLGLNVTIPLKSRVIPYLDQLDSVAENIGAVNCIRIDRSSGSPITKGYNTDYSAFRDTLKPLLKPHHQKAIILGTGGSARAVSFALQELEVDYKFVSRTPEKDQVGYDDVTRSLLHDHPLVINATPLGMFPETDGLPPIQYDGLSDKNLLYDLVYNPELTRYLQEGKKRGATIKNGLQMLYLQADYAWKIWNVSTD